jgi:hypothetical protein
MAALAAFGKIGRISKGLTSETPQLNLCSGETVLSVSLAVPFLKYMYTYLQTIYETHAFNKVQQSEEVPAAGVSEVERSLTERNHISSYW